MSTQAWAEVYVPGAGWQVVPVAGSFVGPFDALIGMTVEVSVTA